MIPKSAYQRMFYKESFQTEWQTYKDIFGDDLDRLFGDDFEYKVQLGKGLRPLVRGQLYAAYRSLRDMEEYCSTDRDHRVFDRIMAVCLNREEMDRVLAGDWVKQDNDTQTLYYRVVRRTAEGAIIKQGFYKNPDSSGWPRDGAEFRYGFTDLNAFQRPDEQEMASIQSFLAEHPDEAERFEKQTDTMISYRRAALDCGLREASPLDAACKFYKVISDRTAFILNITDTGDCLRVVYGFTKIGNMAYFVEHEVMDTRILLHHMAVIRAGEDEAAVAETIRRVFDTYKSASPEELSAVRDRREQEFLAHIHARLRKIGMKRLGTTWEKDREQNIRVVFMAEPSDSRDWYDFRVVMYRPQIGRREIPRCFHVSLPSFERSRVDWQLLTEEELDERLDFAIERYLRPILQKPLSILGKDPLIWSGCTCNRHECEDCWIQKNMFEARGE